MSKTLDSNLVTQLGNRERYGCVLFTFALGSNTYGLWTGIGNRLYNGLIYGGGASVLEVDSVQNNADGSISEFNLTLNENPDIGLTYDVLSSFYSETWHLQSLVIDFGMRDPTTDVIVGVATMFDGLIYQAPLVKGPSGYFIKARCVSQAIRMSENGGKYRNSRSQKALDSADTSLDGIGAYVGQITKTFHWAQSD